ncbi:hypothetical protein [Listeria phage vB_Lmo_2389_typeII]
MITPLVKLVKKVDSWWIVETNPPPLKSIGITTFITTSFLKGG